MTIIISVFIVITIVLMLVVIVVLFVVVRRRHRLSGSRRRRRHLPSGTSSVPQPPRYDDAPYVIYGASSAGRDGESELRVVGLGGRDAQDVEGFSGVFVQPPPYVDVADPPPAFTTTSVVDQPPYNITRRSAAGDSPHVQHTTSQRSDISSTAT